MIMGPQTTDKGLLTELLQSADNPLSFAVEYGSGKNDWDMLAVSGSAPPRNEILIGRLDLLAIGAKTLSTLSGHLDPTISEPLLTGRRVAGDGQEFAEARAALDTVAPQWPAVRHLLRRSHMAYQHAVASLDPSCESSPPSVARAFWSNLSWAVSSREFARYYAQRIGCAGAVTRLEELIPAMPAPVSGLWGCIQDGKRSRSLSAAAEVLRGWESVLLAFG